MTLTKEQLEDWKCIQKEYELDFIPDEIYKIELDLGVWYSESIEVEYRIGDKVYRHQDYHCSCDGFVGWNPEEYTLEEYKALQERRNKK